MQYSVYNKFITLLYDYSQRKRKEEAKKALERVKALVHSNGLPVWTACVQVAEDMGIKPYTLKTRYMRSLVVKERSHGNQLLSDEDEIILAGVLRALSAGAVPTTRKDVIEIVRSWKKLDKHWSGKRWLDGFLSRHSDALRLSKAKPIDTKRLKAASEEAVTEFVSRLDQLLQSYNIKPEFFINADETGAASGPQHLPKTINTTETNHNNVAMTPSDDLRTVLPFIAANGKVWMVVLIFASGSNTEDHKIKNVFVDSSSRITRGNFPIFYATTTSGYITGELWNSIIEKFMEVLDPHLKDLPAILLLDRHFAHTNIESLRKLVSRGIHTLLLPPHTTHVLQPLDNAPFAVLKRAIGQKKVQETNRIMLRRENPVSVLQRVVPIAFKESFKEDVIKAGFANTGLWPHSIKS